MGDSFSSGEGNPPFIIGPDYKSDLDGCHRSPYAYPEQLAHNSALHLQLKFIACSGARATDMQAWFNGEPPQVFQLQGADIVTLTSGGDDIDFQAYATACVVPGQSCDYNSSIYKTTVNTINRVLPSKLKSLYKAIKAQIAKQTKVLVVGYPMMMPSSNYSFPNCTYLTGAERAAAAIIIAKLNLAIMYAVQAAGSQFVYVSVTKPGSPFAGHTLCSSESYFNGLSVPVNSSFHPNALGQEAYYKVIAAYI